MKVNTTDSMPPGPCRRFRDDSLQRAYWLIASVVVAGCAGEPGVLGESCVLDDSESEKHFRLALLILTDHEQSDAEWDFYSRSIDFVSTARSTNVVDFFPDETHPEFYRTFSAIQNQYADFAGRAPEQVLLNFYMATGGRGTIEFVTIAAK